MDINDLKIYKMVAEEENISKTSIKSGFAQSTITNKIKKMENHFGTSFFYRNVTGGGKTYFPRKRFFRICR